jgi:anti-sigma factor ChrR (cupin superfamily)
MTEQDLDALAGEYVLGTLAGDERQALEGEMKRDAALRDRVEAWERRLGPAVLAAAQSAEPPAGLLDRIQGVIDARQQVNFGGITVRAGEGAWVPLARGSEVKILLVDKVKRERSFLLRLAPGGHVPAHDHPTTEECMVLSGDMVIGDTVFYPGDFHAAIAGVRHPPLTSRNGGVIFIRGPIYDGYP